MSNGPSAPTVLVIADPLGRDLVEAYLTGATPPLNVAKAGSVAQALAILETTREVGLALIHSQMPEMARLAGVREVKKRRPGLPVAILAGGTTAPAVRNALFAGACGIIPRRLEGPTFIAALRLMLAGEKYFPPGLLEGSGDLASPGGADIAANLTPRELETLVHLSKGRSNKEIAKAMSIETVTVTLHLTNLYRKLGVTSRAQAVRQAVEAGLQSDCRS